MQRLRKGLNCNKKVDIADPDFEYLSLATRKRLTEFPPDIIFMLGRNTRHQVNLILYLKTSNIPFHLHCPQAGQAFTFCLETESKQRIQGFIKISKIWL